MIKRVFLYSVNHWRLKNLLRSLNVFSCNKHSYSNELNVPWLTVWYNVYFLNFSMFARHLITINNITTIQLHPRHRWYYANVHGVVLLPLLYKRKRMVTDSHCVTSLYIHQYHRSMTAKTQQKRFSLIEHVFKSLHLIII